MAAAERGTSQAKGVMTMSTWRTDIWEEAQPACPTELYDAVKRLKEEHRTLKQELARLQERAEEAALAAEEGEFVPWRVFSAALGRFLAQLQAHASWEERSLYPFLRSYFDLGSGPTITPSFWSLERDYRLALDHMHAVAAKTAESPHRPSREQVCEAKELWMQACQLMASHFELEERYVYPLTDRVLTDIDYWFS
jgi:iron-sulfur cluster repair protein YtfE (RIC family)